MQTNKKNTLFLFLSALTLLCAGCIVEKPIELVVKPDVTGGLLNQANIPKRFQDPNQKRPSTVESAMQLSAKYAELAEQTAALKENNQQLSDENKRLKDRLVPCEAQLNQTNKELAEANDLLIEMRIELNNWKTDILGFRNELRDADKAQLEALLKILTALGGEIKPESPADLNKGSTTTPHQPNHPQQQSLQAGTTSGESNG